ncbi:MBL fold metallo-hydrolase [Halanaerobaculum tunisiense]
MELQQIKENLYYISNPANIGVIKAGEQAILIDSGLDDSTARKILNLLEKEGLSLGAIINTHSHADHCGGNAYLEQETEAKIYASQLEAGIVENPYLEPLYLFSGAKPLADLENKFLRAKDSQVDTIIDDQQEKLVINGIEIEIITLPGHTLNQIGLAVNGVLFCGDAVFAKGALRKHKILFCTAIREQKETLNWLQGSDYNFYLPAHGKLTQEITELAKINLEVIEDVEDYLLSRLTSKQTTEDILQKLCVAYEVEITTTQQYYLMKTITMAYLSFLSNTGAVKTEIKKNKFYWKTV